YRIFQISTVNRLSTCTRAVLRLLQKLTNQLCSKDFTNTPTLFSKAQSTYGFLVELHQHSEQLLSFAHCSNHLPEESFGETLKKLAYFIQLFGTEVLKSLDEVKHAYI